MTNFSNGALSSEDLEMIRRHDPAAYDKIMGSTGVQVAAGLSESTTTTTTTEALAISHTEESHTEQGEGQAERIQAVNDLLARITKGMVDRANVSNNMSSLVASKGLAKILVEGSEQDKGGIFADLDPEDVENMKNNPDILNKNGIEKSWANYTGDINSGQYGPTIAFLLKKVTKNQWDAPQRHVLSFSMISDQKQGGKPALTENHFIVTDGKVYEGGEERQGIGSRQIERYTRYFDPSTGDNLDLFHGQTVYEHNGYIRRNYLTNNEYTSGGSGLTEPELSTRREQLWADNISDMVLHPDALTAAINFNLPVPEEK